MSIYKQGWLLRFLNPENQPRQIKQYLSEENRFLLKYILPHTSLVDVGCGYGRHLELLSGRITKGLGIDTCEDMIELGQEALERWNNLELKVADATKSGLIKDSYDYAICMNNTLGNIEEKGEVIADMRRVIKLGGLILAGVYSERSVDARIEWYKRTGLTVKEVAEDYILTAKDFKSWHFSKEKLQQIFGNCQILNIVDIGYFVISGKAL